MSAIWIDVGASGDAEHEKTHQQDELQRKQRPQWSEARALAARRDIGVNLGTAKHRAGERRGAASG